jgi:hypothetical protein
MLETKTKRTRIRVNTSSSVLIASVKPNRKSKAVNIVREHNITRQLERENFNTIKQMTSANSWASFNKNWD